MRAAPPSLGQHHPLHAHIRLSQAGCSASGEHLHSRQSLRGRAGTSRPLQDDGHTPPVGRSHYGQRRCICVAAVRVAATAAAAPTPHRRVGHDGEEPLVGWRTHPPEHRRRGRDAPRGGKRRHGSDICIVGFLQGTDGKYALVIGMPIGIVDFLQATDGEYALVIGMPIGDCGFFTGHRRRVRTGH